MKIGIAQINPIVGDLEGNVGLCLSAAEEAKAKGAEIIVFPELVIPGCHPKDILFDQSFSEAVFAATESLADEMVGFPPVILGTIQPGSKPTTQHPGLLNAAVLLEDGKVTLLAAKQSLPSFDVNLEPRWFLPGGNTKVHNLIGKKITVVVGEADLEQDIPKESEFLIVIAASLFTKKSFEKRLSIVNHSFPGIFVNMIGGNDELIYGGRSFLFDDKGEILSSLPSFESVVRVIDTETNLKEESLVQPSEKLLHDALVLGLCDFFHKNGLNSAYLGVSGGIDSSLVAAIAAEALGPENVTGIALPSRFTDPRSTKTAEELCGNLGIHFEKLELEPLHAAAESAFGDLLSEGNSAENVQARLRMVSLMAYVNRYGGVLLNTGNKTEASLGYATIYGDTAGTICPIGDVIKPEVYALARWINRNKEIIPQFILDRKPSAELRHDQVDPFDYEVISPQIEALVQNNQSNLAMRNAEHKRWQSGVILKVSEKAFGSGRMIPITRR
ncbi:MAG: NAD(+) synthase [Chloroflexi bacterium]|jgi:NAD+ synthase (glutamine-hydrolysing)|nr:NAD(+) synthase [Chloroflexota bacterium]MBT3671250.1 NAD(+) synthase [Chloroflexota bacterium]MBT4004358.1 NAD(+) synthase [Chloroflexota bacterium]MBT4304291.1 NAD(+) synthase [Chloroflexota bacterium]MBT4534310.1 NAD(+) synthase [Chloroflexota bacterium]